jgi:hypothetical protein
MYDYHVNSIGPDNNSVTIATGSGSEKSVASALRAIADEIDPPKHKQAGEKLAQEWLQTMFGGADS